MIQTALKKVEINSERFHHCNSIHDTIYLDDTFSDATDENCKPVSEFPYVKFSFPKFNPMQTGVLPYIPKDVNMVICSPTASGKTAVIEMMMGFEIHKGNKAIYIAPLKALSQEKLLDWTKPSHFFSNKSISILTGDYDKTEAKFKELNNADIIIMTSEMLDSMCRNMRKDFDWLLKSGCLLIDEAHLMGEAGRGDKLESAIINYSQLVPHSRLLLISATLPNVDSLKGWLTYLNGKDTLLYTSKYRPCTLKKHFVSYKTNLTKNVKRSWVASEKAKFEMILDLLETHSTDVFLIFTATKTFGNKLIEYLDGFGIEAKFYNADLSLETRNELYASFNDKKFRVLISTTSLAWGVNMPARRVIVSHMMFDSSKPISTFTLIQMAGRAGRPQFELEGDVYFLIPFEHYDLHKNRILNGESLVSQILNDRVLTFHVLAKIKSGDITNLDTFKKWYYKTFAYFSSSSELDSDKTNLVLNKLEKYSMMKKMLNENMETNFNLTKLGFITSSFYLYPDDVYNLVLNFNNYFQNINSYKTNKMNDMAISKSLAYISSFLNDSYVSKIEKEGILETLQLKIERGCDKVMICYYLMLNPEYEVPALAMQINTLKNDLERNLSALHLIETRLKYWNVGNFFERLYKRFMYGVPDDLVELCSIPGIGKVYSQVLWNAGIKNVISFKEKYEQLPRMLESDLANKIMKSSYKFIYGVDYKKEVTVIDKQSFLAKLETFKKK